jgi:MFS family permease
MRWLTHFRPSPKLKGKGSSDPRRGRLGIGRGTALADPRAQLLRRERYGWVIVATLAVTETASWGILYYAFSVFITPMERELGWSRTETSGAFSLALGVAALATAPIGHWLDHHSPRALMTAASIAGVVLLVAWSGVRDVATFYLVWIGMGAVMAALLYETAFTVVTKWFVVRRRAALTAITLVAGMASLIFLPLANWLVEGYGWRGALVILAAVFGVTTLPLHAIFLRRAPMVASSADAEVSWEDQEPSVSVRTASRSGAFWLLAAAFAISSFLTAALNVHLVPYLVGAGYSPGFAALAAGLIGASQVAGRILFATALRLLPRWGEPVVAFSLQGAAVFVLALAPGTAGVILAVALFGAGNGIATLVRALAFSDAFGARWYGTLAGIAGGGAVGARAIAPLSTALAYQVIGGYRPLFVALGVASILAVAAARRGFAMTPHG